MKLAASCASWFRRYFGRHRGYSAAMTTPTGRLPLEDAHHEWNAGLDADFTRAREPFDILRDIAMASGVTFEGNKPFDDATAWTLLSVVTKILKAYRGMLILCEAGHGHEAVVLLRVVLEASAQILWICRSDDPRDAVRQAGAYEQKRLHLVLMEAGLVEEAGEAAGNLDAILATIPHVTRDTIKFHYSGLRNFEQLCKQLVLLC